MTSQAYGFKNVHNTTQLTMLTSGQSTQTNPTINKLKAQREKSFKVSLGTKTKDMKIKTEKRGEKT